jgi:uroporphyrinogen decarboxylase
MTSKERFRMIMNRKLPDRLPVDFLWVRNETLRDLKEHFGTNDVETVKRKLGVDFRWMGAGLEFPEFEKKCNGELTGDAPGAGQRYIFHDKTTFENEWGIVERVGSDGKYTEWRGGPLVGKETLDGWDVPITVVPSVQDTRAKLAPYKDSVIVGSINNPFKIAWHICGFEHFMLMMALDPSFIESLYDRLFAWETRSAVLMAAAGADIIAAVGDIAGKNGPMFSRAMFDRFILPRFQKMIRDIKRANPETYVFFHSDGELKAMIPSLIESGLDILNPIESNCMDPAELKREFGDRLVFHGAISVQKTIPNGAIRDVKDEVYTRIRTVGYNGGYIVSNENSFPFNAPLENVLAMYEAVKDFNYDSLR